MRIPLQEIGFKASAYERPNQTWVCGWAKDGNPCKHGPDSMGQCAVAAEAICHPVLEGDRWICSRAEAFGGTCSEGPNPNGQCARPKPEHLVCQPQRSIRASRGRLVLFITAFTFGGLLLMFAGPWRLGLTNPGELSAAHLAIQGKNGQENCDTCHQSGNLGFSAWFKLAINIEAEDQIHKSASEQCLSCHFQGSTVAKTQALSIHGASAETLEQITRKKISMILESPTNSEAPQSQITASNMTRPWSTVRSQLQLARLIQGPMIAKDIACSTCHKEHRGTNANLAELSDVQCQVCHQQPFDSFNLGHPKFRKVPRQNSGILFDHLKHQDRLESSNLNCTSCHGADNLGRMMEVKSFEDSCKGCHEQGSKDHHGDAIRKNSLLIFQLPEINFEDAVYWPTDYAYGESLSPMMAMLMAGDDAALPLLASIFDEDGAAGDLYEWLIETEDNNQPELRVELADALKRLVIDLADHTNKGYESRADRLAKALSTSRDDPSVLSLSSNLASANFVMQGFKQQYLPQVDKDMDGESVSAENDTALKTQWLSSASTSGWRIDPEDGSISYRPVSHSDNLLKHWIDALKNHSTKPVSLEDNAEEQIRDALRKRLYADLKNDFNTCFNCHTQENREINWTAAGRASGSSGYVKFNHSPHMAMLRNEDSCISCHELSTDIKNTNGLTTPRGFISHNKENCESCHAPNKISNSCLNCHQYHVFRP